MNEILQTLLNYDMGTILIISSCSILGVVKLIESIKKLWKKRQNFRQQAINEGIEKEHRHEAKLQQQEEENKRINTLENAVTDLTTIIQQQQKSIDLLLKSDELDIKAWIKTQHEKWIALQCIDSQSLDLVLQRYEIYAEEGGNSWAEKLVDEIKALPTVTVIPINRPE